ncbi:unnamed protein product, partial [Brachionus calyciflorus]
ATAEANNLAAKALAKEFYNKQMKSYIDQEKSFISLEKIEKIHIDIKLQTVQYFESIKKMGGTETSRIYLKELIFELDELLTKYYVSIQQKNSTDSTKTPSTLISLIFLNYFTSSFLNFIWMGFFGFLFKIGFYFSLLTLLFWIYSKYSNQYLNIIHTIDIICVFIWNNIIQILGGKFLQSLFNLSIKSLANFGSNSFFFDAINLLGFESTKVEKKISESGDSR